MTETAAPAPLTDSVATSWVNQVLKAFLKSQTANAAAGSGLLVMLAPHILDYLDKGTLGGISVTPTQIWIIGAIVVAYIIAKGLADHGKEAALLDIRKNFTVAMTSGVLDAAKSEAFHNYIETGNMKGLLAVLEQEGVKQAEALAEKEAAEALADKQAEAESAARLAAANRVAAPAPVIVAAPVAPAVTAPLAEIPVKPLGS